MSKLEKAVNYANNHQELLENYLLDGRCEISNNRAERCAKSYGILLYMPDYKHKPAGVEAMMPWSEFIKERCCGVMNTEIETPENRGQIPV